MANYYGNSKSLKSLADTNITQAAFDIVAAVGFRTISKYLSEGAEKVLKRQICLLFNRCPKLFDDFQEKCIDENPDVEAEYFDKRMTIDYVVSSRYSFFHEVIRAETIDRYYIVDYYAPLFLRTLIDKIRVDDWEYGYTHTLVGLCRNYFDEIEEYISYM